jgi:hypothetical protein
VARYNLDEDGNIDYSSKTDETTGSGDKSTNAPTETRPSPDTTSAEESALQQTSRGMPKGGILSSFRYELSCFSTHLLFNHWLF